MSLSQVLQGDRRFVFLYGTTPPRADAPGEKALRAAERLRERTGDLALDGLIVYDIQDESGRTEEERPFPFLPVRESREYARLLRDLTGRPTICYKCVGEATPEGWRYWLDGAASDYGVDCLTIVGRATSRQASDGIALTEAMSAAREHSAGFTLGGVVIPERHSAARSESLRLIEKARRGCEYFVSQAVYSPSLTARLLRDYGADCARLGVAPKRIVLTFTPCGNERTLAFMKWLGIAIPPEAERAMRGSADPLAESIRLCAANLREVLEEAGGSGVPLGVHVESVSIRKDEIAASIDLFHAVRASVNDFVT
jgi:5,10-methylenetetrahydrofolate reductase